MKTLGSIKDDLQPDAEHKSALGVRSLRTNPHERLEIRFINVFGVDAQQAPTIVKLKRQHIGPKAVGQLKRYVEAVDKIVSYTY